MRKVNWGILGCAGFARRRTIPAMLQTPSARVVGIASRTRDKAEACRDEFHLARAYDGYEALLADADIDAVYIPLPNSMHAEWAIAAVGRGKHVLCEKPLAVTAAEAERVAEAAVRSGLCVMEAFMWRLHPQHALARAAIDSGAIGPVGLIRSSFTFPLTSRSNIRLAAELGGGSMLDAGCYPVSAARFYFADEPTTAFAVADFDSESGVDVRACGVLEFPRGRALFDSGFDLPPQGHLEIVGAQGTIVLSRPWRPEADATVAINGKLQAAPVEDQSIAIFEHFSRCVLDGTAPRYGVEDSVRQARVLDAILISMRSGVREPVRRWKISKT